MKFDCPCGNLLDVDAPATALIVLSAKHFATLLETERAIAALDRTAPDYDTRVRELSLTLAAIKQPACECPRCGRIAWFREGPTRPTVYWLDED
ncbi:MAG: hypothetical protein QM765_53240 [Myxococcales bacterium]